MAKFKVHDNNLQAVRDLIKLYRSITQDDFGSYIQDEPVRHILTGITGLGFKSNCLVCRTVENCGKCIHSSMASSCYGNRCITQPTYERLLEAKVCDVLSLIEDRAKFLEEMLERYDAEINNDGRRNEQNIK